MHEKRQSFLNIVAWVISQATMSIYSTVSRIIEAYLVCSVLRDILAYSTPIVFKIFTSTVAAYLANYAFVHFLIARFNGHTGTLLIVYALYAMTSLLVGAFGTIFVYAHGYSELVRMICTGHFIIAIITYYDLLSRSTIA